MKRKKIIKSKQSLPPPPATQIIKTETNKKSAFQSTLTQKAIESVLIEKNIENV